jgi:dTDP-4-dehydrorhamnose reductase
MEYSIADPLETGQRVLITGAKGQLGAALSEAFPDADARSRRHFDVTTARPEYTPRLVLHAAAWTDVDGAEANPTDAERVNVQGTRNIVALGAPVVYFSTDYIFDGKKREPYVESDEPNPLSVYGRTKLAGESEVQAGWIIRTSWLFGWTGRNFVRTMLEVARRQDEIRVVDDQFGCPTYVGHLADAVRQVVRLPYGVYHVAADGDSSWADFAEAIFFEAGVRCRVEPISSAQLGRAAARPSYSVLRSARVETPRLPHWRTGLRDCLGRVLSAGVR